MIYSPSKFLFIHIPRTGGFSVMQAVGSRIVDVGDATIVASGLLNSRRGWWTHSRACELKPDIPHWDRLWKWAVIRNPWQMVGSSYRRVQACARLTPRPVSDSETDQLAWQFLFASSKMTLAEWIPWHFGYLRPAGGFWGWWCLGERGENLGVEPVRFEELPQRWPGIAARMGMPGQPLPHVNGAPSKVEWTREAVELVGELCRGDGERFGHRAPSV